MNAEGVRFYSRDRRLNLHFDLLPANANVHAEDLVRYSRFGCARAGCTGSWNDL